MHQRAAEEAFFPMAVMFHTIPVMAYAPILVLLLGNGMEAKVAIAALICFFPTLVNMTRGLRAVSPQQLELMRILSATRSEIFFKLRLKSSLPYPVLGAEDRLGDLGDRRDRRRMDRRDDRHRRADHPGDLQFQFAAALCDDRRRLAVFRGVLRRDFLARAVLPEMERVADRMMEISCAPDSLPPCGGG